MSTILTKLQKVPLMRNHVYIINEFLQAVIAVVKVYFEDYEKMNGYKSEYSTA